MKNTVMDVWSESLWGLYKTKQTSNDGKTKEYKKRNHFISLIRVIFFFFFLLFSIFSYNDFI